MDSNGNMSLREFLGAFDFDYDIVSAGDRREMAIRFALIEDEELSQSELYNDLICLVDYQGAYLGDIGRCRFPLNKDSVQKIIDRMDTYIQDSVIDEFRTALDERGIDASEMSLSEMVSQCKVLNVGDGEVSYQMAEVVLDTNKVFIGELIERDHPSLASQIESAESKLMPLDGKNNGQELQR